MVAVEVNAEPRSGGRGMQARAVTVPVGERVVERHQFADRQTQQASEQLGTRRRQPERVFCGQLAAVVAVPERPVSPGPFRLGGPHQFRLGPIVEHPMPLRNLADGRPESGVGSRRERGSSFLGSPDSRLQTI